MELLQGESLGKLFETSTATDDTATDTDTAHRAGASSHRSVTRPVPGTSSRRSCPMPEEVDMDRLVFCAAALAAAVGFCVSMPSDVAACHNAITITSDQVARRVRTADEQARQGRTAEAMRTVGNALHILRTGTSRGYGEELLEELSSTRVRLLRARAERVVAIVIVRRDGAVDRRRMRAVRVSPTERTENLAWALRTLTPAASETGPHVRAQYAEALARFPDRHAEARTILTALADADVMPDAWGHRTLAELSDRIGDIPRRDASVAACHARAGENSRYVCPRLVRA
jgi:hypothetical protein